MVQNSELHVQVQVLKVVAFSKVVAVSCGSVLAMLLALSNADRCSELAALNLNFRQFQRNNVLFVIPQLTKLRRSGLPLEAFTWNSQPTLKRVHFRP